MLLPGLTFLTCAFCLVDMPLCSIELTKQAVKQAVVGGSKTVVFLALGLGYSFQTVVTSITTN